MAKNQLTRPLTIPTPIDDTDAGRRPVAAPVKGYGFPDANDAARFTFSKNLGLKQKS